MAAPRRRVRVFWGGSVNGGGGRLLAGPLGGLVGGLARRDGTYGGRGGGRGWREWRVVGRGGGGGGRGSHSSRRAPHARQVFIVLGGRARAATGAISPVYLFSSLFPVLPPPSGGGRVPAAALRWEGGGGMPPSGVRGRRRRLPSHGAAAVPRPVVRGTGKARGGWRGRQESVGGGGGRRHCSHDPPAASPVCGSGPVPDRLPSPPSAQWAGVYRVAVW